MGSKCGETIRSFGLLFEKSGSFIAFSGVVSMNEEVVKDVIDLDGDGGAGAKLLDVIGVILKCAVERIAVPAGDFDPHPLVMLAGGEGALDEQLLAGEEAGKEVRLEEFELVARFGA